MYFALIKMSQALAGKKSVHLGHWTHYNRAVIEGVRGGWRGVMGGNELLFPLKIHTHWWCSSKPLPYTHVYKDAQCKSGELTSLTRMPGAAANVCRELRSRSAHPFALLGTAQPFWSWIKSDENTLTLSVRHARNWLKLSQRPHLDWQTGPNFFFFPKKNQRLRRQTHVSLSRHRSAYCHFVSVSAMEGNQQGGHATMHVKSEAVDESTPASSGLCSQEPPACKGEPGGGGGGGEHQTAEELQAAATATPVLLCEWQCNVGSHDVGESVSALMLLL